MTCLFRCCFPSVRQSVKQQDISTSRTNFVSSRHNINTPGNIVTTHSNNPRIFFAEDFDRNNRLQTGEIQRANDYSEETICHAHTYSSDNNSYINEAYGKQPAYNPQFLNQH